MPNKFSRWFATLNYPSYTIFFVTGRCNASCKMCFYKENMERSVKTKELTLGEYDKIARHIKFINVLGISGGEPFLRQDLSEIVKILYNRCSPLVADIPTNGYFVESVIHQTEDIAKHCPNMVVDIQLSIDGPEKIHNEIRGLNDSFARIKETYRGLVSLKNKYRNLKVKSCVVYSSYNQDSIAELFEILNRDFKDLDRVVFSVVHGSVSNNEALQFDWEKYFAFCEEFKKKAVVNNISDFHSLFTMALRIVKNSFLKKILKTKDMYKVCGAGRKVVVINELGEVFGCEQLWDNVGNLRKNDYNLNSILRSDIMKKFQDKIKRQNCNCHWGLAMSNSLLYKPQYYAEILYEMGRIFLKSINKPAMHKRRLLCL